jgi:hypothetical protein
MIHLLKGNANFNVYKPGNFVLVKRKTTKKHKFEERWQGPFMVMEQWKKMTYKLVDPNGKKNFKALVNATRMKHFRFRGRM